MPLKELETRYEIEKEHRYYNGIDETMSIDNSIHSLFGVSKVSADLLVQEYGNNFQLKTGVFRCGCITGPKHNGAELHGFLSYLMKCAILKQEYTIFGYKGKQVRDNIHSFDLVNMLWHFYKKPDCGEIYNAGGSRHINCSILESIKLCEKITDNKFKYKLNECARTGDHIWYISSIEKFRRNYPDWDFKYNLETILEEIFDEIRNRV